MKAEKYLKSVFLIDKKLHDAFDFYQNWRQRQKVVKNVKYFSKFEIIKKLGNLYRYYACIKEHFYKALIDYQIFKRNTAFIKSSKFKNL